MFIPGLDLPHVLFTTVPSEHNIEQKIITNDFEIKNIGQYYLASITIHILVLPLPYKLLYPIPPYIPQVDITSWVKCNSMDLV